MSNSAPARPTHASLLNRLGQGVRADLADYRELQVLLERQFDAILHHRSVALVDIAAGVSALTEALEQRRQQRVGIVSALLGAGRAAQMSTLFALLPATHREAMQPQWAELETLVKTCKDLNGRNCKLLMEQHEIMQRVLNGESDTYAPA